MKPLASMTVLAGACLSTAATGLALMPAPSPALVNRPPASLVWEFPSSLRSAAAVPVIPFWMSPAAYLDWKSLSEGRMAGSSAAVLRAASNDARPVNLPEDDSLVRRHAYAALNEGRVNVARCDRVLRRTAPRRPEARFRVPRLNRHFAQDR
jgi:hypothetical protein